MSTAPRVLAAFGLWLSAAVGAIIWIVVVVLRYIRMRDDDREWDNRDDTR